VIQQYHVKFKIKNKKLFINEGIGEV